MARSDAKIVVADLGVFTELNVKRLVLEVHANITEDTPVDLGWARANLVPEIGKPFEGTAGTQEQAAAGVIDGGTAQQGLARVVASYRLRMGPVYLTHNVPYFQRLNDGSSTQAPAGFVQKAIARGVRTITRLP